MESVVAISIFVAFSTILLANYPQFLNKSAINTLAHEIALSVRQAQVYGQNVREFGVGSGAFPSYGVFFSSAKTNEYTIFADISDSDKKYNGIECGNVGTECLEKFIISSGARIVGLCGDSKTNPPGVCGLDTLNISFTRPNPDAHIIGFNGIETLYSDVEITISSPKGDNQKTIVVWSTGQITVE